MKERTTLNRLPGYDKQTARGEFVVFAGMAVVGLVLIGNAGLRSMNYASEREVIIDAFERPGIAIVEAPVNKAPTNIASARAGRKQNAS